MTKQEVEKTSRTVRFRQADLELIEEFLEKNPFFDFSTLTRTAVLQFIKQPNLQIQPVVPKLPRVATRSREN